MAWNVAGELHIPKNITVGSKSPQLVLNAAFHWSPSLILTLLYPHRTSSLVKYLAPILAINTEETVSDLDIEAGCFTENPPSLILV